MSGADPEAAALRRNFRDLGFWNPTHIRTHEAGRRIHRMDLNECPYPPCAGVLAAVARAASDLNRYPDGTLPRLARRLAERTATAPERICWGSGSTQLLTAVASVAVGPGEGVVAPALIWRRFAGVFQSVDAALSAIPNRGDGAVDVEAVLAAVGNRTRLVVVVTPNNPTGLMLGEAELARLAAGVPENVLLFVDEAYHEFAVHAGGPDARAVLAGRRGPWVVTRTFSKAYALAGLRLGYALCSSERVANAIRLLTSTFNIAGVAEEAAMAALDDPDYTRMILARNAVELERLKAGLRRLGLAPSDSVTNFVSADVGRPAGEVVEALRARGIRIAPMGPEQPTGIRVSTGLPEDTDAFLQGLEEVLESAR